MMVQEYFSDTAQSNEIYYEHFSVTPDVTGSGTHTLNTTEEGFRPLDHAQEWDSKLKLGTDNLSVHSLIKMFIGLH